MPETFSIDDEQLKKLDQWMAAKTKKYTGAIGGRFTYSFHPTSLGVIIKVKDEVDGSVIDLSDYLDW